MAKRRKRKPHWTKQRVAVAGEVLGVLLLIGLAVFSLKSSGDLEAVLGLPVSSAGETAPADMLRVHYLDVGQADCTLVRIPEEDGEFTLLIDAGDNGGETPLLAELFALGVTELDAAVFTHPHADHIGGGAEVLRAFPCGQVYGPPVPSALTPTGSTYEDLLDVMLEKAISYTDVTAGMTLYQGENASLQVVAPQPGDAWEDLNNWSVGLRLEYGETAFLFTGDAEAVSEQNMLLAGQPLACDVLKVGHHGSDTSTGALFLAACAPRYAVISCGAENAYGHPHQTVLDALGLLGATVYRTDENGTITAESDGQTVTLRPTA